MGALLESALLSVTGTTSVCISRDLLEWLVPNLARHGRLFVHEPSNRPSLRLRRQLEYIRNTSWNSRTLCAMVSVRMFRTSPRHICQLHTVPIAVAHTEHILKVFDSPPAVHMP